MLALRVRVEMPVPPEARVTLAELTEAERPDDDTLVVSATTPVKPLMLARVIVDVLDAPATTFILEGLAEIVKSTTFTATVTEWESDPLVLCTVTE